MSTVNHGGAVYTGLEAERLALATVELKKGTVWVETDTDAVHFWTGAIWATGGPSELWAVGDESDIQSLPVYNVRIGRITDNDEDAAGYGDKLLFSGGPSFSADGYDSENSDVLWIARYNIASNQTELRVNIGDTAVTVDAFVFGYTDITGNWVEVVRFETQKQAHIVDADGSLADITTKFNTLLAELEAQGIISDV